MTTRPGRDAAPSPVVGAHPHARTIRGGDADLVAYALCAVGYLPWGSVLHVALAAQDGRWRTGTVARADLAVAADPALGLALGEDIAGTMVASGADAVLEVVVGRPPARAEPFAAARRRAEVTAALEVLPGWLAVGDRALLVEGDAYGHVHCAADCCPPEGRPLAEVLSSRLATAEVLDGRALVESRADFAVAPCAQAACRAAARDAARATAGEAGHPTRAWRRRRCAAWDGALADGAGGGAHHPELLGELAAGLADVRVRDAILGALLAGGERGRAAAPLLDRRRLTEALLRAGAPPVGRARRAGDLLADVAAHAPDHQRVHALAALGYLRWWTGQGVQADVVTRQALAEDPRHPLACLVGQALIARIPPPWFATAAGNAVRR